MNIFMEVRLAPSCGGRMFLLEEHIVYFRNWLVALGACGLLASGAPSTLVATDFDVVYLGGQSNMEGFGTVKELPAELSSVIPDCYIYHAMAALDQHPIGGVSKWAPLKPGHGTDFVSTENELTYSARFGVELTLATELRKLRPNRKLAIIKYARNGSSIHQEIAGKWGCWEPDFHAAQGENRDVNQYDHFLATIRLALTNPDIDKDGSVDVCYPIGIVWMQGESDAAHSEAVAKSYQSNLKRLIDLMRAALRTDDLPVVIGRISDSGKHESGKVWAHGDMVREAQRMFVEQDRSAKLITTTDKYGYSDPWHYDSAGYIDLGNQFAAALAELNK